MEFKTIKSIKEFSDLFEMSEDGTIVRVVNDENNINLISGGRAHLIGEGGNTKPFSLKTLHWHSWNKALPYEPIVTGGVIKKSKKLSPEAQVEARKLRNQRKMEVEDKRKARETKKALKAAMKAEKEKRREIKMALQVRKGKLMSLAVKNKLLENAKIADKNKNSFIEYRDKKVHIRTIIKKGNIFLVRVDTQAVSRSGRFFVNMDNDKFVRYNEEVHKKGYGNENIVWPKLA